MSPQKYAARDIAEGGPIRLSGEGHFIVASTEYCWFAMRPIAMSVDLTCFDALYSRLKDCNGPTSYELSTKPLLVRRQTSLDAEALKLREGMAHP